MPAHRHARFIGLTVLLAVYGTIASAQPPAPTTAPAPPPTTTAPAEEDTEPQYTPPAGAADAVKRALDAIREVEDLGGTEALSVGDPEATSKFEEARYYITEAQKLDPANAKAEYANGRMNVLINRTRDAFSQVREYLRTPEGSEDWEAYKIYGDLHFEGGYYVQAEAKYKKALQLNPGEPSVYIGLSKSTTKLGRHQEAVDYGHKAVGLDPTSSRAYDVYASALVGAKMYKQAKQPLMAALALDRNELRDDPTNLLILRRIVARSERLLNVLNFLLRSPPKSPEEYGEFAENVVTYSRISVGRADVSRQITILQVLNVLESSIEQTKEQTPPQLVYEFAWMAALAEQPERAIEALDKLLLVNPTDAFAQQLLDAAQAGTLADMPPPTPSQPNAQPAPAAGGQASPSP